MMKTNVYMTGALLAAMVAVCSCSTETVNESDRVSTAFLDKLKGSVSVSQLWRTAVTLNVNVSTANEAKVWLMSGPDKGTLYDYKVVDSPSTVQMTVPQGQGNTVYLVSVCHRRKSVQAVELTGAAQQTVNLTLNAETQSQTQTSRAVLKAGTSRATAENKQTVQSSLWGNSIIGGSEQYELTPQQVSEAVDVLDHTCSESVPARTQGLNTDYELESKGDFRITWFAGNCLSATPHVLGYYYHSPGTYSDIQYVDISETEIYDYIDGMPKVQYKVSEKAAQQYGVQADHWYDANFDMGDTFDNPSPSMWGRRGDDAYNSVAVFKRYRHELTALRGISFVLKVPAGKRVGFYDRVETVAQPEQYDRFVRMGIKPYTTRENFKAMNFSCEAMNMNVNGSYRSSIATTAHAYWLGMENDPTGGDLDCNDVLFQVSADMDIYKPSIVEPDLEPFGEYGDNMPWTLAFEDVYRNADYDFNDAVVKLQPDSEHELCTVTVMAAGTDARMYLHYDGPDGDVNLGEIHQLLGDQAGSRINTLTTVPQTPFAEVGQVSWPKGYTMLSDAHRFYMEVQRGTCTDCTDVITLPEQPGQVPEALLVAGQWKWPLEGVHVADAYTGYASWAKDNTDTTYWNWYTRAQAGKTVNY